MSLPLLAPSPIGAYRFHDSAIIFPSWRSVPPGFFLWRVPQSVFGCRITPCTSGTPRRLLQTAHQWCTPYLTRSPTFESTVSMPTCYACSSPTLSHVGSLWSVSRASGLCGCGRQCHAPCPMPHETCQILSLLGVALCAACSHAARC